MPSSYPGNKGSWEDMLRTWKQIADLDIVNNGSVSLADNSELTIGVPQHITVTVADNCDIQTVERWKKYRLRILYEQEDGIDVYVTYEVLENIGTNEKIVFCL